MKKLVKNLLIAAAAATIFATSGSAAKQADERQPSRSPADPALEAAFQRALYAAEPEGGGFRAANPAQQLSARFTAAGAFLEEGDAAFGLRLSGYGYGERLTPSLAARPEVSENRIAYRRGSLTEWYVNSPAGLEQGFTLASPPGRPSLGERLVLALEVIGGMRPALAPQRDAVLLESGGVVRLRYSGLRAWDATGRELDARLDVRGRELRLTVADAGAAYPLTVDPWIQQAKLVASDGAAGDVFGWSVAVSGDTAVIGATQYYTSQQGAAYVFTRSNGVWSQEQKLLASDNLPEDKFGTSVAVDGDTAIIGAPGKDLGKGAAYVFTRSGGVWSQQAELMASDGVANAGDVFGSSVGLSGDTALIGASGKASSYYAGAGAAYVFVRSNGVWSQQQKLLASDIVTMASDFFGTSVGLSGDTAVIGSLGETAYVFTRANGVWSQQQELQTSDTVNKGFGQSVGLSGDTAVIGALSAVIGGEMTGAAYVFTRTGGVWSQQQVLVASDGAGGDQFGHSVAVSGDTAVIGTQGKEAAYVFTRSNGVWSQLQKLVASDGAYGNIFSFSVAVSGNTAVITAPYKQAQLGAAYVFVTNGLQVQGVGSSQQFQTASLAAFQLAGAGAGHWTYNAGGQIVDSRQAGIVPENGNLAVVWDSTQTNVWTYLSVDSLVANRAYFARPRTALNVTQAAGTAGQSLISSNLWGADSPLPAAVLAVIQGQQFDAAFTDLLPADAKFAINRVNCGTSSTATIGCLGYGTADPNIGTSIQSAFSTAVAHPVNFNIYGTDPITNDTIPNYTVVPVGISPIIFIANRTNAAGLGQTAFFSDITYQATAQELWTGIDCAGTAWGRYDAAHMFAVNPILRDPISGTMNVFEFNVMVQNGQGSTTNGWFSQEGILNPPYFVPAFFGAIKPAANNPLNGGCATGANGYASAPQGNRMRAIGTDELVSAVKTTQDSIGYLFFGYGDVAPIANDANYAYLTYQTVDPINPSGSFAAPYVHGGLNFPGNGKLPTCTTPCAIAPGASFPNIRSGAYWAWSVLRAVADSGSTALTNLQALATAEQGLVNSTVPDWLPFNPASDGDPGFIAYRIHFAPGMTATPVVNFNATNTPNNGIANPTQEAGGDVGGCLEYKAVPNDPPCRF